MNKKLKLFLDSVFEAEIERSEILKKKGDIILSVRAKQAQEYKKINERQIEKRKELLQYQ